MTPRQRAEPGETWNGYWVYVGGLKTDGTVKQVQSVVPPTPGTDGKPRAWVSSPRVRVAPLPEAAYLFLERLAADRKKALELIPDEVVDELVVHGRAEACRERVAEYHATGLYTPVIMIVPAPGVDEVAAVRQLTPPA